MPLVTTGTNIVTPTTGRPGTLIIIAITTFIISKGVKGGIERYTKVLMPILFVLIVFLAIRALTLPGAAEGLKFYLNPDFSMVNFTVIFRALGQARSAADDGN